jgi:hypothetical protein
VVVVPSILEKSSKRRNAWKPLLSLNYETSFWSFHIALHITSAETGCTFARCTRVIQAFCCCGGTGPEMELCFGVEKSSLKKITLLMNELYVRIAYVCPQQYQILAIAAPLLK